MDLAYPVQDPAAAAVVAVEVAAAAAVIEVLVSGLTAVVEAAVEAAAMVEAVMVEVVAAAMVEAVVKVHVFLIYVKYDFTVIGLSSKTEDRTVGLFGVAFSLSFSEISNSFHFGP
jgi:hypothetical protein